MRTRTTYYRGHAITRCGLSWYVNRDPAFPAVGASAGIHFNTQERAKKYIREHLPKIDRKRVDNGPVRS